MEESYKKNYKTIIFILLIVLIISIGFFSTIGTADVSVGDVFKIVLSRIPIIKNYIDVSEISNSYDSIIWNIRLPRVLLGVLVGSSLSIAGASFQGMFKNPMADPYVLGISSGAALGAAIAIILKVDINILGISTITIFSFLGGLIAVSIVYNISSINGKIPITNLLLSGVAVGQLLTALMSFLMVIFSNDMKNIIYWTMGSLSGKGWSPIKRLTLPIIIVMFLIYILAKDLNILLLGDETAKSLGVDVEKTKRYILLLGTLITAIVVSVSGIIGFVGLIIPHIVRIIFGPDHKILLPASALIGGIFMVFTDTIARTIISPTEIPVGIVTALFGGPFFIFLLRKQKNNI